MWLRIVVVIIILEISRIESGYHSKDHVEIWPPYFSFSPQFGAMLKFWLPYGYRMPVKKFRTPKNP
jgi:hypothetical protein